MALQYTSLQVSLEQQRKIRVLATILNTGMRQLQDVFIGLAVAQLDDEQKEMYLKLTEEKETPK